MQVVNVFPTIIEKFDIAYEKDIFEYLKLIDDIQQKEAIIIPDEFYTSALCNFLWGEPDVEMRTLVEYFNEVILKKAKTDRTYHEIFTSLEEPNLNYPEAIAGIESNKYIKNEDLYINCLENVYYAKKFYLSLMSSFVDFETSARQVFGNLIFLDNCFNSVSSLGSLHSTKIELIRHLDILNRFAHSIYVEQSRDAHQTMLRLNSLYNLNCTGVGGSQESSEFRLEDTYMGLKVNPRCNAHTKLFDARNNYRIYFSWENKEVELGKIIIGSVGGHIEG